MKRYEAKTTALDGTEYTTTLNASNIGSAQCQAQNWANDGTAARWHFFDSETECVAMLQNSCLIRLTEVTDEPS